jgi:hypothetical protein
LNLEVSYNTCEARPIQSAKQIGINYNPGLTEVKMQSLSQPIAGNASFLIGQAVFRMFDLAFMAGVTQPRSDAGLARHPTQQVRMKSPSVWASSAGGSATFWLDIRDAAC